MNWRNRIGIYGTYLAATVGIGFTLPFLPLYLSQDGLSDHAIGWISTIAALSALAQFPIGVWSDRIGSRKPFLIVAMGLLTISAWLLKDTHGAVWIGLLVMLFAENGICRAVIESLMGAEVTLLASERNRAAALGALRMWKPIGIISMALFGSWLASKDGLGAVLSWLAVLQGLGFFAAGLICEPRTYSGAKEPIDHHASTENSPPRRMRLPRDAQLWAFIVAMILFHAANAPGGVYLGLFLKRDLQAADSTLAYAFVASMLAWMMIVWPAGRLADRIGRRPLLILAWAIMALRLFIVAIARTPSEIVVNQLLDGAANGLFSVLAATWVTDRLADPRRAGEAQVIVGTSLVFGSAIGPALSTLVVHEFGYRGLFVCLGAVGAIATLVLVIFVPETLKRANSTTSGMTAVNRSSNDFGDRSAVAFAVEGSSEELKS